MRDPAVVTERWRALGRLLPRDVRERVFDPAFSDLVYGWLTEQRKTRPLPFGMRAVGMYAGCFKVALPRFFVRGGRLTRLGRITVRSAAIVTLLTLVWINLVQTY